MLTLLVLLACGTQGDDPLDGPIDDPLDDWPALDSSDPGTAEGAPEVEVLSPTLHLTRASVALRGHRPSLDELDRVAADPSALSDIVDDYLASDAFGETIREMHGEWLLTDTWKDYYPGGFAAKGELSSFDANAVNVAVSEAPGRLAEHVVVNDMPYSEFVTADYTMANGITAVVWGLPYAGSGGWEPTGFGDGRPAAGVLVEHWYFARHASTEANRQRARGAHVARALLCHDYMNREVRVPEGVSLTDGGSDAIEENAVCVSCHSTLDPLGAFFAPHYGIVNGWTGDYPLTSWQPQNQTDYEDPMFYGIPGEDLGSLGELIADDPRFERCAVRRFYGQMLAVDAADISADTIDRWLPLFTGDQQVKPLLRSIVLSDEFAAARPADGASADAAQVDGLRRATPRQIARSVEDLTGFVWTTRVSWNLGAGTVGEVDLTDDTTLGFALLGGGADGFDVWDPMRTASPITLLMMRSLAALAAADVVENDLGGGQARLLTEVGADNTQEAAIRSQLVRLHLRMFGEAVASDAPEIDASWALFEGALDGGSGAAAAQNAWQVTLFAMLQDPRLLYY